MTVETVFRLHLVLGYAVWGLCFGTYILPWLKRMDRVAAHRAIATLHSFRFFGLVFIVPGFVGPDLPASFAGFAAYWDLATGLLAMAALLTVRLRPAFWLFTAAFNIVGIVDFLADYYHATQVNLPAQAGQMGAAYAIPILFVPILFLTNATALWWLVRDVVGGVRAQKLAG